MPKYIIIKNFLHKNPLINKGIPYTLIKIPDMKVYVNHYQFKITHYYVVPKGHEGQSKYYTAPFSNPDVNLHHDFDVYRKFLGLLLPQQIKKIQKKFNLSQRDMGALTGISHATISAIEKNEKLQTIQEDAAIKSLPLTLKRLIKKTKKQQANRAIGILIKRRSNQKSSLASQTPILNYKNAAE